MCGWVGLLDTHRGASKDIPRNNKDDDEPLRLGLFTKYEAASFASGWVEPEQIEQDQEEEREEFFWRVNQYSNTQRVEREREGWLVFGGESSLSDLIVFLMASQGYTCIVCVSVCDP